MIIILEGPDYDGRDELTRQLNDWLSSDNDTYLVNHGDYEGLDSKDLAMAYFQSMLPALTYNKHVIMNGSWISELVLSEDPRISRSVERMLERAALSREATVIYCETGLASDYDDWRETYGDIPVIDYSRAIDDPIAIIEELELSLDAENGYGAAGMVSTYNTLILCSKWGVRHVKESAVIVPYINFQPPAGKWKSSSHIITDELERLGIPECDLAWVTVDRLDEELSPDIIGDLDPRQIVAIGNVAALWCKRHGINALLVDQPRSTSPFSLEGIRHVD